jgi:predicted N-acyltransferase
MGDDVATVRILDSLSGVDRAQWNALADGHPFLRHEFFHALHETGCASERTGWLPQFVTLWQDGKLAGAMPLYLKSHSYGEYVFDWAWADAYQRHGLAYYPKLLSAVPFSPIQGPRLLAEGEDSRRRVLGAALALADGASSLHILFPPELEAAQMAQAGMLIRRGVQFHWNNPGYASFNDFLAALAHDKRKKIRQERRKVSGAGIAFRRLTGGDIGAAEWTFFYRCYRHTYRAHGSSPYLSLEFFERLGAVMPENLLLAIAERDGAPVGASLCVHDRTTLYGRYWGALDYVPCLHFEACYYQPIEFCIERGIGVFEGGAQGEHKLARGFLPVATHSAHWLARPEFSDAVERFLARETDGIARYIDELNEHAPFRRGE